MKKICMYIVRGKKFKIKRDILEDKSVCMGGTKLRKEAYIPHEEIKTRQFSG